MTYLALAILLLPAAFVARELFHIARWAYFTLQEERERDAAEEE